MALVAVVELYHDDETRARDARYAELWDEYHAKARTWRHGDPPLHDLYNETLKRSGPPGDYRKRRIVLIEV